VSGTLFDLWLKQLSVKLIIGGIKMKPKATSYSQPRFHWCFHALAWLLTRLFYRARFDGTHNIPDSGAAILVCNHVSYVDAIIIYAANRRPVRFVMHASFYGIPLLGWLFRLAGVIPIDSGRNNPTLLNRAFDEIEATLNNGGLVCLFPEGKLTRNGEVDAFRPGIEQIVRTNPVPVVPLALSGLWGSFFSHKDGTPMRRWPRGFRSRIQLSVGWMLAPHQVRIDYLRTRILQLRGAWA